VAIEFTMPKLGLTMEEGTIISWLVETGSDVAPGTAVIEIETDKVQTEVETAEGGLLHIVGKPGDAYRCGERIGWFLSPGESVPVGDLTTPAGSTTRIVDSVVTPRAASEVVTHGGRIIASPFAKNRARDLRVDLSTVSGSGPGGRIVASDIERIATAQTGVVAQSLTFAAAELARLVGLDLTKFSVTPTSPDGRVSREDVANRVKQLLSTVGTSVGTVSASSVQVTALPLPLQTPSQTIPLKGMRGTIATRMRASLQDMAQLTLMMDADMDAVVAHRESLKSKSSTAIPGYTDYVLAATARALRDHPRVNAQVTTEGVALLPRIHVGLAVALDEGLMVPVVHDADQLGLQSIAARTTELATAARNGTLKLSDLEGGTFSVTALGMFGVDGFTPVINPPNAAILGVGRLRDDASWNAAGALTRVKRLTLSLTWDHRAFDGAPAAEFVRTVCRYLDDPTTLS
jgi:pyruvate dehydrogenase E2 component (dihydrolipoamide acetyltransferase)